MKTEKFTAMEWATMEGGHEVVPTKTESFSFLKDIHEARLTKNDNNMSKLSYTDCCERVYLSLLILELMRHFPAYAKPVQGYARNTISRSNYKHFKFSGTDLHNFIYFVLGDDEVMQKLQDPKAAMSVRAKTKLPVNLLNRYLTQLSTGTVPTKTSEFFINLESSLNINNPVYKNIRRVVVNINNADSISIKTAVTKLLFASRAKLRSSDLIDDFERLAALKDLESSRVSDTEPTVSIPDSEIAGSDLVYLAQIVGRKKLFLATKFIELSSQGKPIPSNIAQAFDPAVQMLVDIIQAGPAHVAMLKNVHKRAKNALNK